jgi:phosphopantetheinyl transferase
MGEHRRCEWLSVRVLLKQLLGEEKEIRYDSSGKPYLADHFYYISISHTKGYIALILDRENEVAIDIEYISDRVNKIRARFMSEKEENNLSLQNPQIHLLLHWSAKESLFKILNENNVEFKTQLQIHPFEPKINEWDSFTASETRTGKQHVFTVKYFVHPDYVITCVIYKNKYAIAQ